LQPGQRLPDYSVGMETSSHFASWAWEMKICVGPQANNWNVMHSWIVLRGASPENAGQFYTIMRCNIICNGPDVNGEFQSTLWSRKSRIVVNPSLPTFTPSWTYCGYTS